MIVRRMCSTEWCGAEVLAFYAQSFAIMRISWRSFNFYSSADPSTPTRVACETGSSSC